MDVGLHEDEIEDIIEKQISRVKSVEELRSHTIDESLNEYSKTIVLLASNYEAQVIVGMKMIPSLLKTDKQTCIHKAFQQFKESCFLDDENRSLEFYQCLSDTLLEILNAQLLTPKEFSNHFIELITTKIYRFSEKPNDYEHSTIFQFWTNLMLDIVEILPETCVKTSVFDLVPHVKLQHVPRRTREYLSQLLAKCAPKLSTQSVKTQLYPILIDLCNDTLYEVRACACKSLSSVCKALGSELSMELLIPEMFKYLCDESTLVRTACFQSLVETLDIFDDPDTKNYLLRKIQSFIEYGISIKDENYLLAISRNLGAVIVSYNDIMTTQTKLFFVDVFCQLCKNENLFSKRSINESKYNWCICKINLANCFPSMLLITNSINFENKLLQCLSSLIRDKNESVKEAIVLKIIEIAERLNPLQHHLIINDYCLSLSDESSVVLNASVSQLKRFLSLFVKKDSNGILNESQQMPGHQLVLRRLIQLEQNISQTYKYSVHSQILEAFSLLPWLICTENLIEKILPILDLRINARALPVRLGAIRSMLVILRKIPKSQIRNIYYNKLIEFSIHKNCYKRVLFVEICKIVMELYSKNFFKNYFYQPVILLARDPVVNVRISFLKILVDLKKVWRFQSDREKLENLEVIARNLFHDKDKDVFELAQKAIIQMDSIKPYVKESDDHLNKHKEEEENYLLDLEPKKPKTNNQISNLHNHNNGKQDQNNQNKNSTSNRIQATSTARTNKSNTGITNNTSYNGSGNNTKQNNQNPPTFYEFNNKSYQQQHLQNIDSLNNKRSQNLNISMSAERPRVKPLPLRRNSINNDIFNSK